MRQEQWFEKYLGIPFKPGGRDFEGCDCGGLLLLALKIEKGIEALDFNQREFKLRDVVRSEGREKLTDMISSRLEEWKQCNDNDIRPLDVALYSWRGATCHCAMVITPEKVMHIETGHHAHLEPLRLKGYTLEGVYRHEKLC